MHQHIEEQLVMAPAENALIYYYNEAIIQLGFIVFFACVFPLAPIFSMLTNLLEIRTKMNKMSHFSRRFVAKGANSIGSWLTVMELISFVAIPINLTIMLYTNNGKQEDGQLKQTVIVQYLLDNHEGRSVLDAVMIIGLVEHLLLAIKVAMAELIPDVPAEVLSEEHKRPRLQSLAEAEMLMLKRDAHMKSIEEIMLEIAKEAKIEKLIRA